MGRSKPLLTNAAGSTFVGHLIASAAAAGLARIYVVGRPGDAGVRAEVVNHGGTFVENPWADDGQLSSLQAGLRALECEPDLDTALVMPADMPLVTPAVIARLVATAETSAALILRATHAGRHGHPVIFKRAVFAELHAADPEVGAREVVRADRGRVEEVETGEIGVTIDVDTPDDYLRAFGHLPE